MSSCLSLSRIIENASSSSSKAFRGFNVNANNGHTLFGMFTSSNQGRSIEVVLCHVISATIIWENFVKIFTKSQHRCIYLECCVAHTLYRTSPAAASHISIYMLAANATISSKLLHTRSLTRGRIPELFK